MNQLNYYELEPEDNHFYVIVADITHKCNMRCKNCYIPNRSIPDMDKYKLFKLIKKLPFKCEIRLIGAEPTMREDLPEIISKIKELNHHPTLITNGLKLSDPNYVKSLKEAGLSIVGLSLNGGKDDQLYKKIDGMYCAERKIEALKNLAKMKFFINTNIIIIKNLNESVPIEVYKTFKDLKIKRATIRVKNIGKIGRYMDLKENNYTFKEIVQLMGTQFQLKFDDILRFNKVDGYEEKNSVFFPLEKNKNCSIYMKITDWTSKGSSFLDLNSKRRGRISQNFKIAPFVEHVKINEFKY